MVAILTSVSSNGLAAVEAACLEALKDNVHSADVILNILARHRETVVPITIMTPDALRLRHGSTSRPPSSSSQPTWPSASGRTSPATPR